MKLYRVLPEDQALGIAEKARALSWGVGKARTKELTGTVKQNEEILDGVALQTIGKLIAAHPEIQLDAIPLKMHPPKFSRYKEGARYHNHTDAPWMGTTRTDLSCTLWLSDDYGGGVLKIGDREFKGQPGECIVYNCGTPHEVTPVTSGERICAVTWIQSRIRDPHKRELVTLMRRFLQKVESNQSLFVEGGRIHSALLRMWIEN